MGLLPASPNPAQDPRFVSAYSVFAPFIPSESEGCWPGPQTPTQFSRRGRRVPQGWAVMRWKIWTNPDPNEGLIPAVTICQLPVNRSCSPSLGAGEGASAPQKLLGLYLGCCFSPSSLFFLFLECEYKLYRGAWSLFTPGANNPQLKAEVRRKRGSCGPSRLQFQKWGH